MGKKIFDIIFHVANASTFIVALMYINLVFTRQVSFRYYLLVCYLFFSTIVLGVHEINIAFKVGLKYDFHLTNLLFILSHFIFLGIFVLLSIDDFKSKKRAFFLLIILLVLLIVQLRFDYMKHTYYSASIANISLFIIASIYFICIVSQEIKFDYFSLSSFNVVVGVFLNSTISFPIYLFSSWLKTQVSLEYYFMISSFAPISSCIMMYFFFKSYLLLTRPQWPQ